MKKRAGAASFYIVAFSAVLFTIVALSFAAVILSEVNRTLNSDLSQSAYDSALAGVEDAKVAILNYQSCINQGYTKETPRDDGVVTCGEIIYYMENSTDCDTVAHILGRPIAKDSTGEEIGVVISEKNITNFDNSAMLQAYSCVKVNASLDDYLGTLNSSTPTRLVPLRVADPDAVTSIRISWYSDTDGTAFNYANSDNLFVSFPSLSAKKAATPPTVSVSLIQTAPSFTMDQLDVSVGNRTDRGTLFFVPSRQRTTNNHSYKSSGSTTSVENATYMDISNDNYLNTTEGFVKSNDKTSKNVPFMVHCPENSGEDFACSVTVEVPKPVGSDSRNADTFMLVLSLPYGEPDTDFKIELCSSQGCKKTEIAAETGVPVTTGKNLEFKNAQISIDSTGRAADLYRRVETRVENQDTYFPVASYEFMLTGTDSVIDKSIITNREYNF